MFATRTGTRREIESTGAWQESASEIAVSRINAFLTSSQWRDLPPSEVVLLSSFLRRVQHSGSVTASLETAAESPSTFSSELKIDRIIQLVGGAIRDEQSQADSATDEIEPYDSVPETVPVAWMTELTRYRAGLEIDLPWAED